MVDADIDADGVGRWLRRWAVETAGVLVAAVGGVPAFLAGDVLQGILALALLVVTADRVRLRMDNRSLSVFAREVRARKREGAVTEE